MPLVAAPSYLDKMREVASRLGNPYSDVEAPNSCVSMMRGQIRAAHPDPATPQLSLQLCTAGDYELTADLGAGRFRGRRRSGDAVIGPPGVPLILSGEAPHGMEITILTIDGATVADLVESVTGSREVDFGPVHGSLVRDPTIDAVIRAAWFELTRNTAVTRLYADGIAQMLVAVLLRLKGERLHTDVGCLAPWQLNRVMDMMSQHGQCDLSIKDLADAVGLSPFHFARAFRISTGTPPHRRLVELRIERARQLLARSDLSLFDVALEVGYASSQAFARAFQTHTHMSPSEYRRRRDW